MKRLVSLTDFSEEVASDAFWNLLGRLEREEVEFKESANHLTEPIAAMAMTGGGFIALGVTDKREIVGCELSQRTLDRVMRAAHAVGVDVQLRQVSIDELDISLIAVPEIRGRIVTTPDGRLLRRVGSDNQPLVGDAMARFVMERTHRVAEDDPIPLPDLGEFDLELINRALDAEGRPRVQREDILRGLIDLGLAQPAVAPMGPVVTKAAALLFMRDPRIYVPGAAVQVVRRVGVGPGPGPTRARIEISGPMPAVLDQVIEFMESNTGSHAAVIGTRREIIAEYPPSVLREAVLNALAHRDYGLAGVTVDITVWDDRVEVHSPGSLPGHITLDNIRQEHYSRNRSVMTVLKVLNLVEEYGEGVDRMYDEMEARLMEPPAFAVTPSSVTVTLRNRSLLGVEDQAWLSVLGHLELSPAERRLLVLARREGEVTRRRVRAAMPEVGADVLLSGAVAKGLIVRVGERGGSRYVLSDEVVVRAGASGVEARSRQRQMLLDEIRRRGSISTTEAAEFLAEPDVNMVRHLLQDLTRANLAVARGRTRGRRYYSE